MKLHQDSVKVNFRGDLDMSNEVFNYLREHRKNSEAQNLKHLLQLGLDVANGRYHDQELVQIQNQLDSVIRSQTIIQNLQRNTIMGQADLQDTLTDQMSDLDLVVTPTTKRQAQKNKS